jgi:hypothetical protein|eukprot:17160-Pelagococcus_subviridis.AAC.1
MPFFSSAASLLGFDAPAASSASGAAPSPAVYSASELSESSAVGANAEGRDGGSENAGWISPVAARSSSGARGAVGGSGKPRAARASSSFRSFFVSFLGLSFFAMTARLDDEGARVGVKKRRDWLLLQLLPACTKTTTCLGANDVVPRQFLPRRRTFATDRGRHEQRI